MKKEDLYGYVPAIVTPFSDTGEIIEDAFVELFEFLINRGATTICIAGDNGESWALSAAERGRLVRLAKDTAKGRVYVMMGISAPTIAASLAYVRAAEENGADALLSMPQTYVLKASQAELMARFDKVSAATAKPLVLYNSPRRMGFSLSVDQTETLMNNHNVIGIKESQRDFFYHTHLLQRLGDKMSVMTGPCHYILPNFALGAKGFIATGPEFTDLKPSEMATVGAGAPDAIWRHAHYQLTVLYELLMGTATWPASFKAALNLIGLPAGVPRDPVMPATVDDIDKIKRTFDQLGISYS
ncbi:MULTISPECIES: dihydrodipicolinate synthase family protein [Rhizobium/Agrobacterium group]|uniref:Dihydrodipicolinate synthase family protein n=2 Tax=Rhizobium/Agrobacterium group TaxID=227290 RepID=A0A9X3R078_9HYPH|nr:MULTISPECIES: dihydrodipicolinate synthase family protein [Rhizobium/Agrobacterium group]MBO9126217.1 dihydrodipicolinate synthase family protein [Rhizobium sp. 16-488-2b]MBO9176801.1 dihydrodipicolinate synthase family protein [Rhizobium sp. 16-488-2a]MBO9197370.1 dihydrodipicolinate synthase family protein [Rhizobium sp. 16-449-1b]MCZ7466769.1 dihydrodipicolinate synthase family protein [Rhizobium rhizogenes]MCZ7939201.1 dihydrodipicolinate synthase family protein [Agrobacterium salinitol